MHAPTARSLALVFWGLLVVIFDIGPAPELDLLPDLAGLILILVGVKALSRAKVGSVYSKVMTWVYYALGLQVLCGVLLLRDLSDKATGVVEAITAPASLLASVGFAWCMIQLSRAYQLEEAEPRWTRITTRMILLAVGAKVIFLAGNLVLENAPYSVLVYVIPLCIGALLLVAVVVLYLAIITLHALHVLATKLREQPLDAALAIEPNRFDISPGHKKLLFTFLVLSVLSIAQQLSMSAQSGQIECGTLSGVALAGDGATSDGNAASIALAKAHNDLVDLLERKGIGLDKQRHPNGVALDYGYPEFRKYYHYTNRKGDHEPRMLIEVHIAVGADDNQQLRVVLDYQGLTAPWLASAERDRVARLEDSIVDWLASYK